MCLFDKPLNSQIKFFYSPHCQPYNSNNVSSENLVLYQLMIPKLIFFFILITCLMDIEENGFHVYIA